MEYNTLSTINVSKTTDLLEELWQDLTSKDFGVTDDKGLAIGNPSNAILVIVLVLFGKAHHVHKLMFVKE